MGWIINKFELKWIKLNHNNEWTNEPNSISPRTIKEWRISGSRDKVVTNFLIKQT